MAKMIGSRAQAADLLGISASTIDGWVRRGILSGGPWTEKHLRSVAKKQGGKYGIRSAHGTASRWRAGCGCDRCLQAHNADTQNYRHRKARAHLDRVADELMERLSAGESVAEACEAVGVTTAAMYGRARWDDQWRARLDDVLTTGRAPHLKHGTTTTARSGCSCPECRQAKAASR